MGPRLVVTRSTPPRWSADRPGRLSARPGMRDRHAASRAHGRTGRQVPLDVQVFAPAVSLPGMTSQGRSAGAVLCVVVAMISMITAVILSAIALDATSKVAGGADSELVNESGSKDSPFDYCDAERDATLTEPFMECLFDHQWTGQQDAALREREAAARQADVQAKGNLAIIFGLFGVTFAVCAVVADRGRRPEPHAIRSSGVGSTHT